MKRILSMFIAMALFLTVGMPVGADTRGSSTITIKNNTETTGIVLKDEKYYAYKIMDLDKGPNGTELRYTVDSRFAKFFIEEAKIDSSDVSDEDKLNDFANKYFNDNANNMFEVTKKIKKYIDDNNVNKDGENGEITTNGLIQTTEINNLDLGYYIIIDQGTEGQVVAAAGMGNTNPNLEINLKASKPTVDKEIKENDGDWGIVGDNQIGDKVEYRLKAKLPANITGYTKYEYILHDTLHKGLTFNKDVEVYVGEKKDDKSNKLDIDTDYTVEMVNHEDSQQAEGATHFDITVNVMEGIEGKKFELGDTLYIYYSATLNEAAIVAGGSNDNEVYLEYSNNPYDENSKEEGPDKVVKDYTFKINALKTDEKGEALKGAEFKIFRDDVALMYKVNILEDGTNEYIVSKEGTTDTIVSGENGKFSIIGLDDNVEYTLKETKAPEGFNSIKPIKFKIIVTYKADGTIDTITTNSEAIQNVDGSFELGTTIVNKKAGLLPETGGMGTTLFNVAGIVLMISAAGLFIINRKKRVS